MGRITPALSISRGRLDDARSADAAGPDLLGRVVGLPPLEADDLEAHVERLRVDADALDGARGGPHAELDVGAFEGRAGGARGGQHPRAVAQHELAVGADVEDQQHFVLLVGLFGDDHAYVVRPDEAGLDRQDVQAAAPAELQPDGRGEGIHRALDGGRERRHAQRAGVEAQEQVVHGGVADHDYVEYVGPAPPRPARPLCRPGR